jgi:hypothetical protein
MTPNFISDLHISRHADFFLLDKAQCTSKFKKEQSRTATIQLGTEEIRSLVPDWPARAGSEPSDRIQPTQGPGDERSNETKSIRGIGREGAGRNGRRTWYVLSNLSYMKRVMMLVLPTDWSPRKTSLYLASADTGAIFASSFSPFRQRLRGQVRSDPAGGWGPDGRGRISLAGSRGPLLCLWRWRVLRSASPSSGRGLRDCACRLLALAVEETGGAMALCLLCFVFRCFSGQAGGLLCALCQCL